MGIEIIDQSKEASKKQSRMMLILVGVIVLGTTGYLISSTEFASKYLTPNSVVASVNGKEITQHEFNDSFTKARIIYEAEGIDLTNKEILLEYREKFLEEMIDNTLLLQAADALGIKATDYEIISEYSNIIELLDGEDAFLAYLEANNTTPEEVKKSVEEQIKIQKYLIDATTIDDVAVAEEEIRQMFDKVTEALDAPPEYESVRAVIENEITKQRVSEIVSQHIKELRAKAKIEKNV